MVFPFQSPSHSLSSLDRSLSDQSVDGKAPLAFLTPHRDHQQKQTSVARGHELVFPIKHNKKKDKQKSKQTREKRKQQNKKISLLLHPGWPGEVCLTEDTSCQTNPSNGSIFPAHILYVTRCDALFCPNQMNAHCILRLGQDTKCLISKCMFACVSLCSFLPYCA